MPQDYNWIPTQSEIVHESKTDADQNIPPGFIRQKAEDEFAVPPERRPPDIPGVYTGPIPPPPAPAEWEPLVWRWADTKRRDAIQRVGFDNGVTAYRFEVSPYDRPSEGTQGNHPRAELYSVDPAEKRRDRDAAAGALGSLNDGQEYWATFAVYIPSGFPPNHRWATLFQRKIDDKYPYPKIFTWLTINVHLRSTGNYLDATIPGYPAYTGDTQNGGADKDIDICKLDEATDRWVQFTVHEKLSSTGAGVAELWYNFPGQASKRVPIGTHPSGSSFPADQWTDADGNKKKHTGHFQYGYYRDNGPANNKNTGPGTGVVYHTPLLISKTGNNVPQLP